MADHHEHRASPQHAEHRDPRAFWEERYSGAEPVWSGRVNRSLADIAGEWEPGRSLDLGCGEGGDVLWLAEQGWSAAGIDLSETAIARAREAAQVRGIGTARFFAADLGAWADGTAAEQAHGPFDLVTASFFQSPVALDRSRILRAATTRLPVGGRLLVISHAAAPGWAPDHPGEFPSPESELAMLALGAESWEVELAEVRVRTAIAPSGDRTELEDTVVVVRRKA